MLREELLRKRRGSIRRFSLLKTVAIVVVVVVVLGGVLGTTVFGNGMAPEGLMAWVSTIRGNLIGNDYRIMEYDNFGYQSFTAHGDRVNIGTGKDTSGESSSYLEITIDGERWDHVGSTLIFAQNKADMITDFQIPQDMSTGTQSIGLIAADRLINGYKNFFGKEKVVVISSQMGVPIAMFQGDSVYTEVPSNLPKMTLIHIDEAVVYVHRADIDIFPASMFK